MRLPDLIIENGATVSDELDVLHIEDFTIYGPAALTGAIDIEVSPDKGTTWFSLATAVAAAARVTVAQPHAHLARLTSTLAEAAQRNFIVHGSDKNRPL